MIGAATCAARRGDALIGENTDGWAVIEALESVMEPEGARVVIFGAGQAARAAAVELARAGATRIDIVNRTDNPARQLARLIGGLSDAEVNVHPWRDTFRLPPTTDVIINATRVGMPREADTRLDFDSEALLPQMVVVDLVPAAEQTQLIKEAQALGCEAIDGLDVMVRAGMLDVRLWVNADADAALMRAALERVLATMV